MKRIPGSLDLSSENPVGPYGDFLDRQVRIFCRPGQVRRVEDRSFTNHKAVIERRQPVDLSIVDFAGDGVDPAALSVYPGIDHSWFEEDITGFKPIARSAKIAGGHPGFLGVERAFSQLSDAIRADSQTALCLRDVEAQFGIQQ